jgi:hypothetical protein
VSERLHLKLPEWRAGKIDLDIFTGKAKCADESGPDGCNCANTVKPVNCMPDDELLIFASGFIGGNPEALKIFNGGTSREEGIEAFANKYAKEIPLARSSAFRDHRRLIFDDKVPRETGFVWASRVLGRQVYEVEHLLLLTNSEVDKLAAWNDAHKGRKNRDEKRNARE